MPIYVTYLFYGAIFLSVLLLVEGMFYLLAGPGSGTTTSPNRRLRMLGAGNSREAVMAQLQRERPLPASDHPRNPVEWFLLLVSQSGVRRSPRAVVLTMVAIGGVAAVLLAAASRSGLIAGIGATMLGLVVPVLFLMLKRQARWKAIRASTTPDRPAIRR